MRVSLGTVVSLSKAVDIVVSMRKGRQLIKRVGLHQTLTLSGVPRGRSGVQVPQRVSASHANAAVGWSSRSSRS